jgi:hypothetical protein
LPKRGANALEKAGVKVQDLVGKRLRLRGLLDATFGPQLNLPTPISSNSSTDRSPRDLWMSDVGHRRSKNVTAARRLAALSLVLTLAGCASLERVGVPPLTSAVPVEAPKTLSIDSPASLEA